jgi:RES domain-containing protein
MVFWRISSLPDLRGENGLHASGRWHFPGQPVVYFTESPASALLEICVHTATDDVPQKFTLLKIEGPVIKIASIPAAQLPGDWQSKPEISRELGTQWLRKNSGVLLRVPSAILPETWNYLFNPLHPDAAKFRVTEAIEYPFDTRLKR